MKESNLTVRPISNRTGCICPVCSNTLTLRCIMDGCTVTWMTSSCAARFGLEPLQSMKPSQEHLWGGKDQQTSVFDLFWAKIHFHWYTTNQNVKEWNSAGFFLTIYSHCYQSVLNRNLINTKMNMIFHISTCWDEHRADILARIEDLNSQKKLSMSLDIS